MATTTRSTVIGPSPRELADAFAAAESACAAYFRAEEVRPGVSLCARGRVVRALDIIGKHTNTEDLPSLKMRYLELCKTADERRRAWIAADRHYNDLCARAGIAPTPTAVDACQCDGCKLMEANDQHIIYAEERRSPLPKAHWRRCATYAEARTVAAGFSVDYLTAIYYDRERGDFVVCAGQPQAPR